MVIARLLGSAGWMLFLLLTGCSTVPRQTDFTAGFQAACAEVASAPNVEPGSETERQAIERLQRFLGAMTATSVEQDTPNVYARNAYLNDTLKTLRGPEAIQAYFRHTLESTDGFTAEFQDVTRGHDGFYYFRWIMKVRMKAVSKGDTVTTLGISLVRFDAEGRVLVQQDYWDSASGLFQHVPGIGYGIRAIKARL